MINVLLLISPPKSFWDMVDLVKREENFFDIKFYPQNERFNLIDKVEAIIGGVIDEDLFDKAKKLKFIQVPYAGVDTLNFEKIKKRGIVVANAHENAISVAEHGFTLMLSLVKKIVPWDKDLRYGIWHGWMNREPLSELYGKTIGIIGLGSIGVEMAKRAKCFGMKVIGVKRDPKKNIEKIRDFVDEIYSRDDIEKVIEKSQFIFVSLPLTEETKNLFDKDRFSLMRGKYFINVSRGEVVNEEALYFALKDGILKGAAIDTWFIYPRDGNFSFPSRYPIHRFDNVVMSPHTAGYTYESIERNFLFSIRNTIRFFKGERIKNRVSLELKY